jgi:hypothetical protein
VGCPRYTTEEPAPTETVKNHFLVWERRMDVISSYLTGKKR